MPITGITISRRSRHHRLGLKTDGSLGHGREGGQVGQHLGGGPDPVPVVRDYERQAGGYKKSGHEAYPVSRLQRGEQPPGVNFFVEGSRLSAGYEAVRGGGREVGFKAFIIGCHLASCQLSSVIFLNPASTALKKSEQSCSPWDASAFCMRQETSTSENG